MKQFVFCVTLSVLVILIGCSHGAPSSRGPKRSKMSSVYALTPSMRVGRSGALTWDIDPELHEEIKRKLLNKIIRVGRRGSDIWPSENEINHLQKRTGNNNMNTGMWFGPRLGRIQKRDNQENPWTYIILGERQVDYTPRLGRESEEILDEQNADANQERTD